MPLFPTSFGVCIATITHVWLFLFHRAKIQRGYNSFASLQTNMYIYLERAYRPNFHFKSSLSTVYIAFSKRYLFKRNKLNKVILNHVFHVFFVVFSSFLLTFFYKWIISRIFPKKGQFWMIIVFLHFFPIFGNLVRRS